MSEVRFPVEAGHIMMFARAIGDTNPAYFDEAAARKTEAGGIIAPPTFPMAMAQFDPEYRLRPKAGESWFGSGRTASGIEGRSATGGALHAEQEFNYHRPLRPGDVLTCEARDGASWEKESKRAGRLSFRERIVEHRNQHGELLVVVRAVLVKTEDSALQKAEDSSLRKPIHHDYGTSRSAVSSRPTRMPLKAGRLEVGESHTERVVENLTRTQIVQYAGASGDYNPIHTDEVYAVYAGYKSIFAHGMLTMGLTGKMLTNYAGDTRLMKFGVRFTKPVWPGDTLDATATVAGIRNEAGEALVDLSIRTVNQSGEEVLTGRATARIDR